nr:formate dehydrogenase accessory sulfurtransferase FdhD [Marinibacterium profundimaris]
MARGEHMMRGTAMRDGASAPVHRPIPEEVPVALVYNGSTQAVMMATPHDLADFALGFSLTEGIVTEAAQIRDLEVLPHSTGIEIRMWLSPGRAAALARRRRMMSGPVGCGLCGIDSLEEATRPLPRVRDGLQLKRAEVTRAVAELSSMQPLRDRTRAVHGAGFLQPGHGVTLVREDVGRHNALDKLIGALAAGGTDATAGAFVITSRVSVEMVQKCAIAGASVLIAVSAPTALAVRQAGEAGLTLIARTRDDGFDTFTHPERIKDGDGLHVA